MSYDEEEQRRRIVVETPTERREVVHSERTRVPDRRGYSAGMVAAVALVAVAATAIVLLLVLGREDGEVRNDNQRIVVLPSPQSTPPLVQQPATAPPPTIIQQAPPPQPAQVVLPPMQTPTPTPNVPDDAALQASIEKKFLADAELAGSDIKATVSDGEVTLTGTVNSEELRRRAERIVRPVRGVRRIDTRITVVAPEDLRTLRTPSP